MARGDQDSPHLTRTVLAAATLLITTLAVPLGGLAPTTARSASVGADEARFLSLTNQLRASVGAPALTMDAGMSDVARGWAQQMAANGGISHNPSRGTQITGWSVLGENVGMGSTVDIVHQALVNSPPHYENLTDAEFTLVGIGVAYGPNLVYVAEDFMAPAGSRAELARTSAPDPEPAPIVEESPPPAPAPSRPAPTTTEPAPVPAPVAAPAPPAPPAPEPMPAQLRPVIDQLRHWTAVFFPGPDPSIALSHDGSRAGDGR